VLGDEDPDSRGEQEDPRVEERPDLEANGHDPAPGDAVEEGGLPGREDVARPQAGDGADHVGVHAPAPGRAAMRHGAPRAGLESTRPAQRAEPRGVASWPVTRELSRSPSQNAPGRAMMMMNGSSDAAGVLA